MKKKEILERLGALRGKLVAVSGATGGLGRELCEYLCRAGVSLVLVDRSEVRSRALIAELKSRHPGLCAGHVTLDLEDIDAVKRAVRELSELRVDYLVLNAGAYSIPRHACSTGLDNVFMINFLSPYVLSRELLPEIKERGGKVVAVGSIAHAYSKTDRNDIDFSRVRSSARVYGNAKRHLMLSLMERREYGTSIAVAHPGIAVTGITAHYPKWLYALIKWPMKLIFMKPRRACLSIFAALTHDCGRREWFGPRVLDVWGLPARRKLRTFTDSEAQRVAVLAEELYERVR